MSENKCRYKLNKELAQMLKGGVIMDVTTPEQAKIAEAAGACAVMALERIPADIRAAGGVSRMSDPKMIKGIQDAVSIPVMAKCRIGHFVEAQLLEAIEIDYIDESEVLSPADDVYHIDKTKFKAGQVLEIEFERTCGYYYLFNTFKKEILVHLFVNGDYEGFKEASNGLRYNKYYETYLDELSSVWNINENKIYDDTNFADITYSTPKAYLFTSDKKFITADEDASGIEAENVTTDVTSGTIIDNYTFDKNEQQRETTAGGDKDADTSPRND